MANASPIPQPTQYGYLERHHQCPGMNLRFLRASTLPLKLVNGSSQVLKCDFHPGGSFLIVALQEGKVIEFANPGLV